MKFRKLNLFFPFLLFVLMLIDGQLSNFFTSIFSLRYPVVSHILFIAILFYSLEFSPTMSFISMLLLGFFYDAYYLHVIGIATIIFPLISFLLSSFGGFLLLHRWTRFGVILIFSFLFDMFGFMVAHFLNISDMSIEVFIVYSLAPSLVFNALLSVICLPIFEKIYL